MDKEKRAKIPAQRHASVELAQTILEEEGDPLANYLGYVIGRAMTLNYDGLAEIFNTRRAEFEERGVGDLLTKMQSDVDDLFSGFVNVKGE